MLEALERIVGPGNAMPGTTAGYGADAAEAAGLTGAPDAVVLPGSAAEVAEVVAWCYENERAIVPRGGGTGFSGGAVPTDGGIVLGLERLDRVRSIEPGLWRMEVEAGVTTHTVRRRAREEGLYFPPDPGAAEQSLIGGNIATNAGGPHAFKHGATGAWVTGIEAVVPPGETVRVGGPFRKDVAGYDLLRLLIGSEGTLGVITAAWLRLIPAPEERWAIVALYENAAAGVEAIETALGSGVVPAALEYLDSGALSAAGGSLPGGVPDAAGFAVVAEAEGAREAARRDLAELREALAPTAVAVREPEEGTESDSLWRWRDGVSMAVTAVRGGKLSEDIVVPLDRLAEAVERIPATGEEHGLEALSWGHAGDGNLHATLLIDPSDPGELERAAEWAEQIFALAVELGGSVSGEHGLGLLKSGQLQRQWSEPALRLHEGIKRTFDPKGLMNPGKKLARPPG